MILSHLAFGVLCGITAALHALTADAHVLLILLAYSLGGTSGLLFSIAFDVPLAETAA